MDNKINIFNEKWVTSLLERLDIVDSQNVAIEWLIKTLKGFRQHHAECLERHGNKIQEMMTVIADLEEKLKNARKLLCNESEKLSIVVKDRKLLINQLNTVKEILRDDKDKFQYDTREKLSFLNQAGDLHDNDKLTTILELDSTDYLMSELSYTLDEEDSTNEKVGSPMRRSRRNKRNPIRYPSDEGLDVSRPKKSRGKQTSSYKADVSEQIVATTTVTVPHKGPVSAKSTIEAIPSTSRDLPYFQNKYQPSAPPLILLDTDSESATDSQATSKQPLSCRSNIRLHQWSQKSHLMGEPCTACFKKIKFSTVTAKCSNCKAIAHMNCKDRVPLPCVPVALNTPNVKTGKSGTISDFVPAVAPMVPPLVVHCIREIEARGLSEVGLYRVPGSDKEVKQLKEKLIKARGVVDLSGIFDIHVICGCLKDFLRSLKEYLIPMSRVTELSLAVNVSDSEHRKNKIFKFVEGLPQPNRDTLSYLILHLQRVCVSPHCKMPVSNISKMFGPTIIAYSTNLNKPEDILFEANAINKMMAELILLPAECWQQLLNPETDENQNPDLMKTPSRDSIHGFFTNSSSSIKTVRKFRFFDTP